MTSTTRRASALIFVLSLGLVATLQAQTVTVDPRYVEFTASPDHNSLVSGQAVLTGYTLRFYLPGATQPFQSQPLGKPTPGASDLIRVDMAALLTAYPAPGVTYEARVAADGPGGSAASAASNQFQFTDPCAATLTPASASVAPGTSTGSFTVTVGTGCARTASSNQGWLTITGGATGTGPGTVSYSVAANPATLSRSATITVGGATFTVTQAGVACTLGAGPTSVSVGSGSSPNNSVAVTAPAGCGWTASSNASWLTVTAGTSGSGNGTVTFTAAANTTINQRTGTLTVAGITVTVTQAGLECTYSLTPATSSVGAGGTTGSVNLTSLAGCTWTASSSQGWLAVTNGSSGTGSRAIGYSVAANTSTTARSATLTIGGEIFTVTQAGSTPACTFAAAPTTVDVASGSSAGNSVGVTAGAGCGWTASSNASWLTITSGSSGSGSGTVVFTAAANTTINQRTGTLSAGGVTITVRQAGLACTYSFTPPSTSVSAGATTGSVSVTTLAGCARNASSNQAWLTITSGGTGSGSGTLAYAVAANTGSSSRTGTMSIGGQPFTVTQAAPPASCTYSLSPTSLSLGAQVGTATVRVITEAGCPWTARSSVTWASIAAGASGTGTGTVTVAVTANTAYARTTNLSIAGQSFALRQYGTPCSYTITPPTATLPASGGTSQFTVTATSVCSWTTTSNAAWATIQSGHSGAGNGTVTVSVTPNNTIGNRTATITIGGVGVTITQLIPPVGAPTNLRVVR